MFTNKKIWIIQSLNTVFRVRKLISALDILLRLYLRLENYH